MVNLGSAYQGYLYAYPHKTAYRKLDPRPRLDAVWAGEDTANLLLYVHVPYCEMRCGFCNLFTRANPPEQQVAAYLAQLRRQARRVAAVIPDARYARAAIGGGTPTYLTAPELTELFDLLEDAARVDLRGVPLSVETSPSTATPDRLAVLGARGASRISIGVQSFLDTEAHAAGRPQRRAEVERALDAIRAAGAMALNIDLIYGIPGQTRATWDASLDAALRWAPEELYLYPLYVRPLTGLGRRAGDGADPAWDAQRLGLYRHAVARLAAEGYEQLSMRQFRRAGGSPAGDAQDAAGEYCCQDDGMVGLGCGARSYTTRLHYSFDYAVSVRSVRGILADYLGRPERDFDVAEVGFALDAGEQRRRWLLKSLLRAEGVDAAAYAARFGTAVDDDFPALDRLRAAGYAEGHRLTAEGLAHSDAIGPWLISTGVRAAMTGHVPR
ncbi:STM4012 family radical SAM protein [Dactylosporangium vinaceum]|uniref:Heme chaperone HemW n=1 Tax=Dactylosporangium vinaceum TaxID=53362 RepID=A0ABV5LZU8_9ACTN|nr:STM4012 family radical SAM protein [Dactylosporangium vinaceum]UAB94724.1 STM4012 family radical SAM protein [Dactylosporangium vinaceum]